MNVRLFENKKIDKARWDATVRQCSYSLIYAQSVYLDSLCPAWSALINEDYSLIMPLTSRKKWGIAYLYQPPFCQQLGIFGTVTITEQILEEFVTECKKHYSFAEIFLNYRSVLNNISEIGVHKNYILNLNNKYGDIRASYTTDLLKKNLQRTEKFNLQYSSSNDIDSAVAIFEQLYGSRTPHVTHNHYTTLVSLAQHYNQEGNAFVREVKMLNGELLACGLFLKDHHRIYNIASSTLPNGRTFEANHFLFDQLIQEFAGTAITLDFEGSDIPGIERFYKKFGAINEPYYFVKWNNLPWPARLLKQ